MTIFTIDKPMVALVPQAISAQGFRMGHFRRERPTSELTSEAGNAGLADLDQTEQMFSGLRRKADTTAFMIAPL